MPRPRRSARQDTEVTALTHTGDARANIPTAELEPVMAMAERQPVLMAYERRNRDLDPQLVWRGKDEQDLDDMVVPSAAPLYPGEGASQSHYRRPGPTLPQGTRSAAAADGPVRRLQRPARPQRPRRVLPARPELVQPDDSGRQPASHGLAVRAGRTARQGAVHLHRPALRHQVQLKLPVVHHQPRRA